MISKYDAIGEATTRGEWLDGRLDELVCVCVCTYDAFGEAMGKREYIHTFVSALYPMQYIKNWKGY
jgi:hypothetical protein